MHQMDVSIPYRQIYNPQIPQVKIMKPKLKTASIWKFLLLIIYKGITPLKGVTPLVNRNLNNNLKFKNI